MCLVGQSWGIVNPWHWGSLLCGSGISTINVHQHQMGMQHVMQSLQVCSEGQRNVENEKWKSLPQPHPCMMPAMESLAVFN